MGRVYPNKFSKEAAAYFRANEWRWAHGMRTTRQQELHRFERWLSSGGHRLEDLNAHDLSLYCGQLLDFTPAGPRLKFVRDFLIWCQDNRFKTPDTKKLFRRHLRIPEFPLSPAADRFLVEKSPRWKPNTLVQTRSILLLLHGWMGRRGINHSELNRQHLEAFFGGLTQDKPRAPATVHHLKITLRNYLDWLAEQGEMPELDTGGIIPPGRNRCIRKLSPSAREYLRFLSATVKPRTWIHNQTVLGSFYSFLSQKSLDEDDLSRRDLEAWLIALKSRGNSARTRQSYIRWLRRYLYWRYEHGRLKQEPSRLLLATDLPKAPRLLPRPIPPDVDREIQRRLRASDLHRHRAVFLLRRTGIRVNELWSLPADCVQQDPSGTSYLKIPLGKMNNERLVPLDPETLELIQKIREQGASEREDAGITISGPIKLVHGQAHPSSFCSDIRDAFREITSGLVTPEPLRLHRLRHTFATEMLNAGMSLYGVMHLLGHRHVGTTLIYAAITQVTVREEFFAALEKMKTKYVTDKGSVAGSAADLTPIALADDLARSLRRLRGTGNPAENSQIQRLLKRLEHIRDELKNLS